MSEIQNGIFLTHYGGLTPASFLGLIGLPLLFSGHRAWGGFTLFLAFIIALRSAMETIKEEEAEAACAQLKDPADRKDCVYDILATQDVDMVGAY